MATICRGSLRCFHWSLLPTLNASEESVPGPFSSKTSSGDFWTKNTDCDSLRFLLPGKNVEHHLIYFSAIFVCEYPKNQWPKNIGLFDFFWCDPQGDLIFGVTLIFFTPTRVQREAVDTLWSCALNHWMPRAMPNGCDNYTPEIYYWYDIIDTKHGRKRLDASLMPFFHA